MKEFWREALQAAAGEGALILFGPGAPDPLPPGAMRRHVPPDRLIPLAEGARMADPSRRVVAVGGDGDLYGAGLGDLLHAVRRNTCITCVVAENGMAAGHTASGGAAQYPLRPAALALESGATFVAQGTEHQRLPGLVREALQHPGFALINVWQKPHEAVGTIDLEQAEGYDKHDRRAAQERLADLDHLYIGVICQEPERASFEEVVLGQAPLVTAVWTLDTDDWERVLYGDDEEEEAH